MGAESRTYYVAVCDCCGGPWMNDDEDVILGQEASQVVEWAKKQGGWFEYRGELRCVDNEDCLAKLAAIQHEYVVTDRTDPFCVICGGFPNGHLYVQAIGQQEIQGGDGRA